MTTLIRFDGGPLRGTAREHSGAVPRFLRHDPTTDEVHAFPADIGRAVAMSSLVGHPFHASARSPRECYVLIGDVDVIDGAREAVYQWMVAEGGAGR